MPAQTQHARLPHYAMIEQKIPTWMKRAASAAPRGLRKAFTAAPAALAQACLRNPRAARALALEHRQYQKATLAAKALFSTLPDLESFATQQLAAAIKDEFQLEVDVANTYLFDAVGYAHQRQLGAAEPQQFVRSLKHHALQNFESLSTEAGAMDVPIPRMRSVILDQRGYMNGPPFDNVVDIEPTAFAALCRRLDIGGQYQALIDAIYYPAAQSGALKDLLGAQSPILDTLGQVELAAFWQSLHCAYLQAQVGQAAYDAILATSLENLDTGAQATFSFMTLWQTELNGMLLIQFEALPCVVLYTPHAVDSPIREYPSLSALASHLSDATKQDLTVITRHIPDAEKARLGAKLQDHLTPLTFTLKNVYERAPDPKAELPLIPRPFNRPFQAEVLYQNFTRLRDNARFHAVPTLAMDAKTFHDRLAYFESIALAALNVVGFVVPEVGYLLMAATVLQLGHEVYEGIESWENDDRQQAYAYLLDVLENVAFIAITAAAERAIKAELGEIVELPTKPPAPVEAPSFIEELVEVELPDGSTRLWNPDLSPFAQSPALPEQPSADELGLYRHAGKLWLPLEGKVYSLKRIAETGTYRIEHPTKASSYQPALRHNGQGTWLHELDRPREWQGRQLFQRLGHRAARFDDRDATRILEVSGIDENTLRQVVSDNQALPAPLMDTLERFRLDREVNEASPYVTSGTRQASFAERYRQLPGSQAPGAAVLQRVYQRLPNAFVEELLAHANNKELEALKTGRIPGRISEEARLMQQQVRLMRAYEGLYLTAVDNPDTDRLVLHSLPSLPGWSADTAIELHRGGLPASLVDRIGGEGTPGRIITRTPTGYWLAAEASGQPDTSHASLTEALFAALPQTQLQALVPAGVIDAQSLAERIKQAPLLPRWALRKVLKMQRPAPRSPMRLADGRVGYRLSGAGKLPEQPSRASLLSQLAQMTLAPEFAVAPERILTALENAGRSPAQIQMRIEQLRAERQELRQSLSEAFAEPGQIAGLGARHANRQDIELALWQHWIHSAVPELDESTGVLRLSNMFIAEFPRHLPEFIGSRVSRLQLDNIVLDHSPTGTLVWTDFEAQLSNVFRHFPNLSALEIGRHYDALAGASEFANSLPLIVSSFPRIEELRLINQNLTLYPLDLERFASRDQLRYLDLSGNRLAPLASFSPPDWFLDYLGLDWMALEQWPDWLGAVALERIGTLSLRENNLVRMPTLLSINADNPNARTRVLLDGNPLRPAQLLDLYRSQANVHHRFEFSLGSNRTIEEYQGLREATEQWATASTPDEQTTRFRTRIGQSILDFWERRVRDDSLTPWHLDAIRLEDFPPMLPEFFAGYADIVRLSRVQATVEQLEQWLQRFTQITHLTLDGHIRPLTRLPQALTRLPLLSRLSVLDQGLEIDNQAMDVIARIPAVREVDLSGNLLSPDLRSLNGTAPRLDRLALRNAGLETWPAWLESLMPRYTLDLRDNRLTTLPQAVLENPPSVFSSTAILLTGNPLDPGTMRTAHLSQRYDRSFTFDMDLPFDILNASPPGIERVPLFGSSLGSLGSTGSTSSYHRHGFAPWTAMLALDASPWLEGAGALHQARSTQWQQLRQAGDADNLLQLITQLSTAVPYRNTDTRPAIIERVWHVLAMAVNQPEEREVFDAIAAEAIREGTCPDGILLQFQQVEQMSMITQAALDKTGADRESRLYRILLRLFRQERLDEIAAARSLHQDAAEVRLAYRRLLATRLDLLAPADEMMFGADVSSTDATDAALRIWEAEAGEDFLEFAINTPFWADYLREAHADAFEQIETKFQSAVNNLQYDDPEASLDQLEAPTRALETQRDKQVGNLIAELTFRIRAEHR